MLKCEHLVKKYITTTAISDLSLEIEPGHIYALLPSSTITTCWKPLSSRRRTYAGRRSSGSREGISITASWGRKGGCAMEKINILSEYQCA